MKQDKSSTSWEDRNMDLEGIERRLTRMEDIEGDQTAQGQILRNM
jgi:hypothetical protein